MEKVTRQKHAFGRRGRYTFISSRTFTRGRYSPVCNAFGQFGVMRVGVGMTLSWGSVGGVKERGAFRRGAQQVALMCC